MATKQKLLDDDFIARIEQLELVSRRVISGLMKGDRLSKRRGYSNEFTDFRPYAAGDDLRDAQKLHHIVVGIGTEFVGA